MTCVTPNSRSIGALTSPVNAPCSSQCIVCAPNRTGVPNNRRAAAGIDVKGGATTISIAGGNVADFGRNASRNAVVSAAVLCIFQLPAIMVLQFKRGDSGKRLAF